VLRIAEESVEAQDRVKVNKVWDAADIGRRLERREPFVRLEFFLPQLLAHRHARESPSARLLCAACPMCEAQLPRMLIARDMTATIVASEIVLSSIISILARDVSGMTSVVLNAVAVEYPRNR
jgi:hypothetical protein